MKRIVLAVILLGTLLISASPCRADAPTKKRPNIVFLLADDLRWNVLGCTGDKLAQTPNLDALAKRGVLFRNQFVTTSICAVSRASIFSGQYARRHKINDFATSFSADAFALTYPMLLKHAGYRVGFIGKFGVGNVMPAAAFDYWRGFPGQGSYFDKKNTLHLTRRMGDQALEFLKAGDRSQPFCLSLSFKSPHAMDAAKREYPPDPQDEPLFKNVTFPVPKTAANPKYFQALPEFVQKSESRTRWQRRFATPEMFQTVLRDYYRLVTGMDREIGRIVAALDELGLADNTIIIFTSDNGYFFGEHGLADKWYLYEESIRVPLIVFDPTLAKEQRNRSVAAMTLNIDMAATMLDYAGVAIPKTMQGQSVRPWVRGDNPSWRQDWFYEHHTATKIIPPSEGVRTTRWTYLRWLKTDQPVEELYDLQADPLQERDLAMQPAQQETLRQLRARWQQLRKELE